jgi:hypothetical protein
VAAEVRVDHQPDSSLSVNNSKIQPRRTDLVEAMGTRVLESDS